MEYYDVRCPYCDAKQEINHDDGYGYDEDRRHEQECTECEKAFVYTTSIMYSYEAFEAPCLNGEEHSYKSSWTVPREYTRMECKYCDESRKPTEEELALILSGKRIG